MPGADGRGVLRSPTGLAPLADLGVTVAFRTDRGRRGQSVVARAADRQPSSRRQEALVTAAPAEAAAAGGRVHGRRGGRRPGDWRPQRLTAVTGRRFVQSLRVSDARFVVGGQGGHGAGGPHSRRRPARRRGSARASCSPAGSRGWRACCRSRSLAVCPGTARPPVILEQTVLVTDGPTVFAPGLLDVGDLAGVTGFELRHKGRVLGVLSLSPVPAAAFNAEGGSSRRRTSPGRPPPRTN